MKRIAKGFLTYAAALLIIVLLLSKANPLLIWQLIKQAAPRWLFVGIGYYLLTNVLRAYRMAELLQRPGLFSPLAFLPEMFALSVLNNALPARSGELSLPYFLHRRHRVSVGAGATALLMARIFDFMAVGLLYVIFAFLELDHLLPGAKKSVLIVAVLLAIVLLPLLAAPWVGKTMLHTSERLLAKAHWDESEKAQKLLRIAEDAVITLADMKTARTYLLTFFWTLLAWLGTFAWFSAFMRAMGFDFRYPLMVVGATFAILAKAIPFVTVGGFGAYEAGWALGFHAAGLNSTQAIATGFAVNIFTLAISLLCGGTALLYMSIVMGRDGVDEPAAKGESA